MKLGVKRFQGVDKCVDKDADDSGEGVYLHRF